MIVVDVTPEERLELELVLAERDAAYLVARLVDEGLDVDEALELVSFPTPGEWPGYGS